MTTTDQQHMDETAVARLLALLDTGSSGHTLRPLPGSFSNVTGAYLGTPGIVTGFVSGRQTLPRLIPLPGYTKSQIPLPVSTPCP